jgi:hypothetical protein
MMRFVIAIGHNQGPLLTSPLGGVLVYTDIVDATLAARRQPGGAAILRLSETATFPEHRFEDN